MKNEKNDKASKASKSSKDSKENKSKNDVLQPVPSKSDFSNLSNFSNFSNFFNRELSWIAFNKRVLDQATDGAHPLLERAKFMAIFSTNLDEFFMIRMSALRRQFIEGIIDYSQDGLTPAEQLAAVRKMLMPLIKKQKEYWQKELLPELAKNDIHILQYSDLTDRRKAALRRFFEREIYPILTPLGFDPGHPFPHISNLSLNLAIVLKDKIRGELFARLKIPRILPRLLPIPNDEDDDNLSRIPKKGLLRRAPKRFVWFEDIIKANLDMLFPGIEVENAFLFKVTRDADLDIEEDEADDLLDSIQESIEQRPFGSVVRLEVEKSTPKRIREILTVNLELSPYQVYTVSPPIGMSDLLELLKLDRPELKDAPFLPAIPHELEAQKPGKLGGKSIFEVISKGDLLLYHPYDSFIPVVDFIKQAAKDPDVLAIKQTLYRAGQNSPVIDALMEARRNQKQVAVMVELKARFDEENNITWARALESVGVHVSYGFVGLKTHSKICMVVRREKGGIKRYVHLGTGNYNASTAAIYGDFGLMTSNADIGADASDLFNALTGYSRQEKYRKLILAPNTMRAEILSRIKKEIEMHKSGSSGHIIFKLNSIVDRACIEALYEASCEGVKIELQVRGVCCLKPQVKGLSENIRVTSIVGRFLEHARLYYFAAGGAHEILLGSADLMPRNLDRRVEILFPITDECIKYGLMEHIMRAHLEDNDAAYELNEDGSYTRPVRKDGEAVMNSQSWLLENKGIWRKN